MHKVMLIYALSMLGVACAPIPTTAQQSPQQCGQVEGAETYFESVLRTFTAREAEPVRSSLGLPLLPPGTTVNIVLDRKVCQEVVRAVLDARRENYGGERTRSNEIDFTVFRVEGFLVVQLSPAQPKNAEVGFSGPSETYFVRESDGEVLGFVISN